MVSFANYRQADKRPNLRMAEMLGIRYASGLLIFLPILCAGKREFDSLVSFIETGEFEYEEYPREEQEEDELEVFGEDGDEDFGHDEL